MKKSYLMAPGPVSVAPHVLAKMSEPIIHHRSPAFSRILTEAKEGLKRLYKTSSDVFIFASSGTGAMEAAVANVMCRGDTAVVVRGGKFGERWAEILEAYGVNTVPVDVEWGEPVRPEDVARALEAHPDARAVFLQAHETSTGVKHPVEEIAGLCKARPHTLVVVDAISALGVYDIRTDEWGLDLVVSGSQKSFGLPPGLSFLSVSPKAWPFVEKGDLPRYYFDLRREKKAASRNTTAYTPAVSLVIGLREVLKDLEEEGLERAFARHRRLAEGTRLGVEAMGLEIFSKAPSEAVTVIKAPEGMDGQEVVKILREDFGITIAGGQGRLKGKIFRISHMGHLSEWDMILALSAVERALLRLGHPVELGSGVRAAERYFAENPM